MVLINISGSNKNTQETTGFDVLVYDPNFAYKYYLDLNKMKCGYEINKNKICKRVVKKGEDKCWQHNGNVELNKSPKSTKSLSPNKAKSPKPVKAKSPKPVKAKSPKPVKAKSPKPPKPVKAKSPKPPKPVKAKSPKPVKAKSPKPVKAKSPKSPKPVKAKSPKKLKSPIEVLILYPEEIKIEEVKTEEILVVKQWESECENCDVLEEKIHKNENINWEIISSNSHVLKDYINRGLDNENYQWNYQILSSNESLTKTFVSKNLHKEWNWHLISKKFNIGIRSPRLVNIIEEENEIKFYEKYIKDTYEDAGNYLF